jgi:hypothetical protein
MLPCFNHWKMYILWHPLNFHQSSSLFHCVSCCLACVHSHHAVSSTSCHTGFPLPWASTDLRQRSCRIQLCMHMFKVLSLIKLSLIPGDTCHDFPACKTLHTIITANVVTLRMWKLALILFLFSFEYILVKFVCNLSLWLCDRHNEMRSVKPA